MNWLICEGCGLRLRGIVGHGPPCQCMLVKAEDLSLLTGRCVVPKCWRTPHHDNYCFWHYHGTTPRVECTRHDFKHGACRRCHIPRGDLDPVEVQIERMKLSRMERYPT